MTCNQFYCKDCPKRLHYPEECVITVMLEVLKDCYTIYEVQTNYFKDMDVAKGVIAGSWLDTPVKIKNIISGKQEG